MNKKQAEALARLVGGSAYQSGGDVWAVSIPVPAGELILSCYGWTLTDGAGKEIIESEA